MLQPLKETKIIKQYCKPPKPDNITDFPFNPLDVPVETFKKSMERREQNQRELHQWVKENLKPDIDYGAIHLVDTCQYARAGSPHLCSDFSHWSMPVLWKPGAEKIIAVLGLTVFFPNIRQFEMAAAHKQEITEIVLKCELRTQTGKVAGEGVGARHVKQDEYNLNKALKMCAKSAMIDAVLRVGSLSAVFTTRWNYNMTARSECNRNNLPQQSYCNHYTQQNRPPVKLISKRQLELVLNIAGKKGLTSEGLNKQCNALFNKDFKEICRSEATSLISHLNSKI